MALETTHQVPLNFAVCLAVLALNFLGDGLRDAADPYAQEGH